MLDVRFLSCGSTRQNIIILPLSVVCFTAEGFSRSEEKLLDNLIARERTLYLLSASPSPNSSSKVTMDHLEISTPQEIVQSDGMGYERNEEVNRRRIVQNKDTAEGPD